MKKLTLKQLQAEFARVAPDAQQCEDNACASLERTRYWNWFRIGYELATKGRVRKSDADHVKQSPRLKK